MANTRNRKKIDIVELPPEKKQPPAKAQRISETIPLDQVTEVYTDDISMALNMFSEQYNLDLNEIEPSQWAAALMYAQQICFKDKSKMKMKAYSENIKGTLTNNNAYDVNILYNIWISYEYLCRVYKQRICKEHYILLTGIDDNVIYKMRDEERPRGNATISGKEFYKKMENAAETSLQDKMLEKSMNPMKTIAILNNKHGWSSQRVEVVRETKPTPLEDGDILGEFGISSAEQLKINKQG